MSLYWGQHFRSDEFAAASEGLGAVFQELWRERPLWGYGRPNTFRSTVVRDAKRHVEAQARGLLRVFCFHYIGLPLTLDSRVEPHFNLFNEYSPILPFHELLEDRTTSSRHFLSSSRLAQGISPREGPRWVSFAEGVVRACRRPGFADSLSCGGRTRRDCRGQAGLRVLAFGSYPCSRTIVHVLCVFPLHTPALAPRLRQQSGFPGLHTRVPWQSSRGAAVCSKASVYIDRFPQMPLAADAAPPSTLPFLFEPWDRLSCPSRG